MAAADMAFVFLILDPIIFSSELSICQDSVQIAQEAYTLCQAVIVEYGPISTVHVRAGRVRLVRLANEVSILPWMCYTVFALGSGCRECLDRDLVKDFRSKFFLRILQQTIQLIDMRSL